MNYLLTEDEVLYSRFLIFFLSCTNDTKFLAKKEKEFHPGKNKSDGWSISDALKKPFSSQGREEAKPELSPAQLEQISIEENLHKFLEEAHPYLNGNYKHYAKYNCSYKSC